MMRTRFLAAGLLVGGSLLAAPLPSLSVIPGDVVASPLQDPQAQRPTEVSILMNAAAGSQKVGLPDFTVVGGSAALQDAARQMADVLWADLEFEREFYMIPRKVSASIPVAATPESLDVAAWGQLGADFVLMGTVRESGGSLAVEIRLATVKAEAASRQTFGESYAGCTVANPRFCAHSISDDIHKKVRALDGVARTRLAFTSDRDADRMQNRLVADSGQGKEIYISDYDGAGQRRVTVNRSLNLGASWGPDGRMLTYTSWATNFPDIYLTYLDGRSATRPFGGTAQVKNWFAVVSPDGSQVAYASTRGSAEYDIWIANRDGSNARNLTNTPKAAEGTPVWSPSGRQIAFMSDRLGMNQLYVMNADGTGLDRLPIDQRLDRPSWSRLNYIAFTIWHSAGQDVGVIDLATRQTRIITDGRGSNASPTVAPNGRHIAFVTSRWGKQQIAMIDSDGKNIRQITDTGNNSYPTWSPTPGGR